MVSRRIAWGMTLLLLCFHLTSQAQNATRVPDSLSTARQLFEARNQLDLTIWGPEVLAQRYESRFVRLWDQLLRADDTFRPLAEFPFSTLSFGEQTSIDTLELGIRDIRFGDPERTLSRADWHQMLADYRASGYRILQTEWHHGRFEPPQSGRAARSEVSAVIHVEHPEMPFRAILRMTLDVEWADDPDTSGDPVPETILVRDLQILDRHAAPAFKEVFKMISTTEKPRILPLAVYDLNGDGLSEVIIGGQNTVMWNRGHGEFSVEQFLEDERSIFDAAVLADFTGDGVVDFVAVDTTGYPHLFEGNSDGRFVKPGVRISDTFLRQPKVFTAGDIDNDGDLDLFIANYRYPYRGGQMPTPYYDANDGYPAVLLRNEGGGLFSDVTELAGLGPKRMRRTYSSSLVDLDDDRDLDLVVVSDFAGLDYYLNDGNGHFTDVSSTLGDDRYFFGMGHTFGDYNGDGLLDMYVTGMSSTTARRLDRLGLGRADKPEHNTLRAAMSYGNRMFLRDAEGFHVAPFNSDVARTGWSWGATSFDFDNDGDRDIFVANGHVSGESTQDYCTVFWRHDIYVDGYNESPAFDTLFQEVSTELRQAEISWNGYEHNVLLMNRGEQGFVNVSFLFGISFEYDARAIVGDDLDGDGRVDLLVVEYQARGLDEDTYVLHIYQNLIEEPGNWIGVRVSHAPSGVSPIGATVRVITDDGLQIAKIVTGDSFSSQHPATVHFGVGTSNDVVSIEVEWTDGTVRRVARPAVNQYLSVGLQ